jgi:hypothetical protein
VAAERTWLPIVNGFGSLKSPTFRPVKLDCRFQDGESCTWSWAWGATEVRTRLDAVGTSPALMAR